MNNGGCAEICNNTVGNFLCTCNLNGYEVIENNQSCEGMYIVHTYIRTFKNLYVVSI